MTDYRLDPIASRGVVYPKEGMNSRSPYEHQRQAMQALDQLSLRFPSFSTLVVLPTGGGKTYTATNWLLRNAVAKRRKVLWIAHRHLLLDQAAESFVKYAYADMMPGISAFSYRIVSGLPAHNRASSISRSDDVVIGGKDSLRGASLAYVKEWLRGENELYLVVDEAHHAAAKTYRRLIEAIREVVPCVKIIGLTATPFRTLETEKNLLSKIFKDGVENGVAMRDRSGIAYQIGLQDLIGRQILSRPVMNTLETDESFGDTLNEKELEHMQRLDSIPDKVAVQMVASANRNRLIVDTYVNDKEKYGQTIVFAVNIAHAFALQELFQKKGVRAGVVVSPSKEHTRQDNERDVEAFRNGELNVLVNVNILTEGVDLPQTKSVFLARPTASSILMTQMIGRALRGVKSGGTAESNIVSFVDGWDERVAWVNPESLFAGGGQIVERDPAERARTDVQTISISKIREFASLLDEGVDTSLLEGLPFIERIPLGMYVFSYTERGDDERDAEGADVLCQVMVYSSSRAAYDEFTHTLQPMIEKAQLEDKEFAPAGVLETLVKFSMGSFFKGVQVPPVRRKDIESIFKYFIQFGAIPEFYSFDAVDRGRLDVGAIAREIVQSDMGRQAQAEYENGIWEEGDDNLLRLFFGNKRHFLHAIDMELRKITNPDAFASVSTYRREDYMLPDAPPLSVKPIEASRPLTAASPQEAAAASSAPVEACASDSPKPAAREDASRSQGMDCYVLEDLMPSEETLAGFERYVPIGVAKNPRTGLPIKKFGPHALVCVKDGVTSLFSYGYRVAEARGNSDVRLLEYEHEGKKHGWSVSRHAIVHLQDFIAAHLGLEEALSLDDMRALASEEDSGLRIVQAKVAEAVQPEEPAAPSSGTSSSDAPSSGTPSSDKPQATGGWLKVIDDANKSVFLCAAEVTCAKRVFLGRMDIYTVGHGHYVLYENINAACEFFAKEGLVRVNLSCQVRPSSVSKVAHDEFGNVLFLEGSNSPVELVMVDELRAARPDLFQG